MKLAKLLTDILGFLFFVAVVGVFVLLLTNFSEYDIRHILNVTFDTMFNLIKLVLYI